MQKIASDQQKEHMIAAFTRGYESSKPAIKRPRYHNRTSLISTLWNRQYYNIVKQKKYSQESNICI